MFGLSLKLGLSIICISAFYVFLKLSSFCLVSSSPFNPFSVSTGFLLPKLVTLFSIFTFTLTLYKFKLKFYPVLVGSISHVVFNIMKNKTWPEGSLFGWYEL